MERCNTSVRTGLSHRPSPLPEAAKFIHFHLLSYTWLSHICKLPPCSLLVLLAFLCLPRPPALQHVLNEREGAVSSLHCSGGWGGGDPCLGTGRESTTPRSHWKHLGVVGLIWLWTGNEARLANFQVEQSWKQKFHWSREAPAAVLRNSCWEPELAQEVGGAYSERKRMACSKTLGSQEGEVWGFREASMGLLGTEGCRGGRWVWRCHRVYRLYGTTTPSFSRCPQATGVSANKVYYITQGTLVNTYNGK